MIGGVLGGIMVFIIIAASVIVLYSCYRVKVRRTACMHVAMCTYILAHMHMHTYMHMCTCKHINIHLHMHVCMDTHTHIHTHIHTHNLQTHKQTYAQLEYSTITNYVYNYTNDVART